MKEDEKINILESLPEYEKKQFIRWIAEAAQEHFKDPENQRRFEEWKKSRNEQQDVEKISEE